MSSLNKVMIIGNLGKDPEVRFTGSGSAVANLAIATSETWKDKNTGENQERTEWHRIVLFGRVAEVAGEYLKKGSKIFVEGKLQTRKWTDQNQVEKYTTEIVGSEMRMLDSRSSQMTEPTNSSSQSMSNMPPEPAAMGASVAEDDDIPF